MPHDIRVLSRRAALLALASLAALATSVHAGVVVTGSYQSASVSIENSTGRALHDLSLNGWGMNAGTLRVAPPSGNSANLADISIASGPEPRGGFGGSWQMRSRIEPGTQSGDFPIRGDSRTNWSTAFTSTEPFSLSLSGTASTLAGSALHQGPVPRTSVIVQESGSERFRWSPLTDDGTTYSLDTTLDLGPGSYTITFGAFSRYRQDQDGLLAEPTVSAMDMSYTIIPAPGTLALAGLAVFFGPARRRRATAAAATTACCIFCATASASVTIVETYQHTGYWYAHTIDPLRQTDGEASDAFGWFSHAVSLSDAFGTGDRRSTISTQYSSILNAGPLPSGSVTMTRELSIGSTFANDGIDMLVQSYFGAIVDISAPTQFVIDATMTSSQSSYSDLSSPATVRISRDDRDEFSWRGTGGLNLPVSIGATVLLEPGRHNLFIYSSTMVFESSYNDPTPDISIDFDVSFAFVPAPSTCVPLGAALAGLSLRRRR
jgi:hypothetical protein